MHFCILFEYTVVIKTNFIAIICIYQRVKMEWSKLFKDFFNKNESKAKLVQTEPESLLTLKLNDFKSDYIDEWVNINEQANLFLWADSTVMKFQKLPLI